MNQMRSLPIVKMMRAILVIAGGLAIASPANAWMVFD